MTQAGLTPSLRLILEDASLSAKAKGIAALLEYLRTSGRTVRNGRELSELVRDGRDAVYKAIRELRIKGYVEGRGPKIKIINNVRSGNPGKPQSGFSGFCQTNNPDFQDLGVPAIRIFRIARPRRRISHLIISLYLIHLRLKSMLVLKSMLA